MRYYKNNSGGVAKVLITGTKIIIMVNFKTLFFNDTSEAGAFLAANGYY